MQFFFLTGKYFAGLAAIAQSKSKNILTGPLTAAGFERQVKGKKIY
ncbi:MAG: hypothetical protein WBC93_18615 [Sulfitobacter sp.]